MRKKALATAACILASTNVFAGSRTLNGAGATFPYPVYVAWARAYYRSTGNKINYQGIGSGGGQRQIAARVVNFAGSDEMLNCLKLNEWKLYQFPGVTGSIVVVYNLPGVGDRQLKLSNRDVSDIFLGKVKYWDNPEIKADNPRIRLPHMHITVVHRAEGSGTTWNFTYWLSHISREWKSRIGYGKVVDWPTGIGEKGNAGVAGYVRRIRGAIGYVEYAYKLQSNLKAAVLQTKSGRWVEPTVETFKAAASKATWTMGTNFYTPGNLLFADGDRSWPLTVGTMILLPREKKSTNKKVIRFFDWAYKHGDAIAEKLGYVPLPSSVKQEVREYWKRVVLK